jgi:peptidyl-prolyl cis-trans isomerase SurA
MKRELLASFSLALLCLATAAPAATLDRLEASVNSSLILLSDVRNFRETAALRAQLDPLFAGTPVAAQGASAPTSDIVDFLINERMILQAFPVTDAEVEQEITSIQTNNRIDRPGLKAALHEQGYRFEDYFELIRVSAAKRNLIDRDIRTKVTISDDDVKNYFYNHYAKSASAPVSYRVRIISLSPSTYKTTAALREAAQGALKALRAGEPFEEVAKRVSDDPTAPSGGDLGTLTDSEMSPLVREALKKLKIGEVSPLVSSPQGGYIILKLVDVASAETERFNKMKDEIRNQLATAEYAHQIQLWLERQRQSTFIHRAGEPSVPGLAPAGK